MENVKFGEMINYWIKEKGSMDLDTTEEEIKNFYESNHRGPIEFLYWLNGDKESIYFFLNKDERGPQLSDEEIEENGLVYSFYEVSFNCVYEDGNIYATHLNGVKLEERVKV